MKHRIFIERQNRVLEASGVPPSVAHALDHWVEWMRHGEIANGFPSKSAVIVSRGITCFDDMDAAAKSYIVKAVDGAIKSLNSFAIASIFVIWTGTREDLAAVGRIDAAAVLALKSIHRSLVLRGAAC